MNEITEVGGSIKMFDQDCDRNILRADDVLIYSDDSSKANAELLQTLYQIKIKNIKEYVQSDVSRIK